MGAVHKADAAEGDGKVIARGLVADLHFAALFVEGEDIGICFFGLDVELEVEAVSQLGPPRICRAGIRYIKAIIIFTGR